MIFKQKEITLPAFKRGFHLVTSEILAEIREELTAIDCGLLHIFIKHTSASLTINENADPTVRQDFESYFNKFVPENEPYYIHTCEGSDDMPAHLKSSLLDSQISIPITQGQLNMGVWQGIYLCEHRDYALGRHIILTIQGH